MSTTHRKVLTKMAAPAQHSRYWLDSSIFTMEDEDDSNTSLGPDLGKMMRLAAVRRGIANFVQILTQKAIPVVFSNGKNSYTDGKEIVIAADEDPTKFDPMVGLALHEASHVLLSDFDFIKSVFGLRNGNITYWSGKRWGMPVLTSMLHPALASILKKYDTHGHDYHYEYSHTGNAMLDHIKDIMNILEDRRIDKYVYQNASGYRPYYDALYQKYFFTKDIGKNLKYNPQWRTPTVENYINRLLFAFHPDSDLTALAGLPELVKLMDIDTIERLGAESPKNSAGKYLWKESIKFDDMPVLWKEANLLYAYILKFVALAATAPQNQSEEEASQQPPSIPQIGEVNEVAKHLQDLPNMDGMPKTPEEMEPTVPDTPPPSKSAPFNEKKGNKEVEDVKKMMDGELKRKKISAAEAAAIYSMEEAAAELVDVKGSGVPFGHCMVTRKITDAVINSEWFPFGTRSEWVIRANEASIAAGRRMGAILEQRLQVRNDPIMTTQTRLPQGNLDRRLLAQLGMDITSVFNKTRIDQHRPVMLHLTLDASGSMSGDKWSSVVTVATALAYLSTRMRNVDAIISLRGGLDIPMVSVLFDSRKDTFKQYQRYMKQIRPTSNTPEGLCYTATLDMILETISTHDVYLINFSDGEPAFSYSSRAVMHKGDGYFSYGGQVAFDHTRHMVQRMRERGVKILSYFISDTSRYVSPSSSERISKAFRYMYGQDAQFVDVRNATEVLRTLNKLLLARGA